MFSLLYWFFSWVILNWNDNDNDDDDDGDDIIILLEEIVFFLFRVILIRNFFDYV